MGIDLQRIDHDFGDNVFVSRGDFTTTDASALLSAMATASQVEKIGLEIKSARAAGRDTQELAKRTGLARDVLGASLQELVETKATVRQSN